MTYMVATVSVAAIMSIEQNISRHICVNAVFPRLVMRLLLIFVAIAG
jgi:hypothetical protein